jgi:hypothetical protein
MLRNDQYQSEYSERIFHRRERGDNAEKSENLCVPSASSAVNVSSSDQPYNFITTEERSKP